MDDFPYWMASEQKPAEGKPTCERLLSYIGAGAGRHRQGESVDGLGRKCGIPGLVKSNPSSLYNPRGVLSLGRVISVHSNETTRFSETSTGHKWSPRVSP